jgi:O-antigen/teichoic acid export membrane protein
LPNSAEGARSPIKAILGPGVVFAGMTAAGRAVIFLLLPIFTRVLTPAEYGQLSILLSIFAVAIIVFACGTDLTIFRSIVQLEDEPGKLSELVAQVWTFLILAPILIAAIVSLAAAPFLAGSTLISPIDLALTLFLSAVYVGATTLPLSLLRAQQRLTDFVHLNLISALLTPALITVALVVLDGGVQGWLIASLIGSLLTLLVAFKIVPYSIPQRLATPALWGLLRSSLPVMPHFLAMWSLQLADRVLLAVLVSAGALGVYSLGANAALPVLVVLVGINQALMPEYARAGKGSFPDAAERLRGIARVIELQVGCVVFVCLACALLVPVAINLFLDAEFHAAANLAPWFVLGYGLFGLESIPMNGVTLTHGHTRWVWVASILAAAVNLVGIYAFTPSYGLQAAAIATAVGYGVLLIAVELYATALSARLPYRWRLIIALILAGSITYGFALLTSGNSTYRDLIIRSLWVGIAAAAVAGMLGRARIRGLFASQPMETSR